ncbi:MAG: hypothetical protein ACQEXQ_16235 [Bacillota bacterium]
MSMTFHLTAAGMREVVPTASFPVVIPSTDSGRVLLERLKAGAKVVVEHIERNKVAYRIGATTLIVLFAGGLDIIAHAAAAVDPSTASIDEGARKIYRKLISVGKWVIIIKGGFDTINSTVQGDFIQARKSFLAYLLVYIILLGLPWAFGQVEILFEGL